MFQGEQNGKVCDNIVTQATQTGLKLPQVFVMPALFLGTEKIKLKMR